jgi:hypothetical protein
MTRLHPFRRPVSLRIWSSALACAAAIGLSGAAAAADLSLDRPASAVHVHRHAHRHLHHHRARVIIIRRDNVATLMRVIGMSYEHNYGPGPLPGTIATYDGSLRAYCAQGAAAYRGQDRRRHACAVGG